MVYYGDIYDERWCRKNRGRYIFCPKSQIPGNHQTSEEVFERIREHYSQVKEEPMPHTHTDPELNARITEIIDDFRKVVEKAKSYGLDIKLTPSSIESLELYFHDDYPDTILVDKEELENYG